MMWSINSKYLRKNLSKVVVFLLIGSASLDVSCLHLVFAGPVSQKQGGRPAQAGSAATVIGEKAVAMPWEDPERQECGFECLYQRANEVMGLEFKYMVEKLSALETAWDNKGFSIEERERALGKFCKMTSTQNDLDKCFALFKKMQIFALRKMQSAMTQNYDSASRISNVQGSKELVKQVFYGNDRKDKKRPQSPHVITFEDLEKRHPTLEVLGSPKYERWAEGLPFRPSEDDFVKFAEKPRDPANPAAGTFLVVARDSNGGILRDPATYKAYKSALEKYNRTIESEKVRFMGTQSFEKRGERPVRELSASAGSFNKDVFVKASKIRMESSVPKSGKYQIASQNNMDLRGISSQYARKGGKELESPREGNPASPGRSDLSGDSSASMTDEDFRRKGTVYLYYSPQQIGEIIDKLDSP